MNFRRKRSSRSTALPEVTLTPLIDTALTLLIIFIITTPVLQDSIRLSLPETKNTQVDKNLSNDPIVVSIDSKGTVFVGSDPVVFKNLKAKVKDKLKLSKDKSVYIKGDKGVIYEKIIQVVDEVQGIEGVTSVNLPTRHSNKA